MHKYTLYHFLNLNLRAAVSHILLVGALKNEMHFDVSSVSSYGVDEFFYVIAFVILFDAK